MRNIKQWLMTMCHRPTSDQTINLNYRHADLRGSATQRAADSPIKKIANLLVALSLSLIFCSQVMASSTSPTKLRPLPSIYQNAKAINYSPYRGAGPGVEVPTQLEISQDLALLTAANYSLIRLFGADAVSTEILTIAAKYFPWMKFQLGIAISPTDNSQIQTGINLAHQFKNVVTVSVGNETEFATGFPDDFLRNGLPALISQVRSQVKQPVTSDHTEGVFTGVYGDFVPLLNSIDFVAYHDYPGTDIRYAPNAWDWQQLAIPAGDARGKAMMKASVDYLQSNYNQVAASVNAHGKRPIVLTETGWKAFQTDPQNPVEPYAASPVNQKIYFDLIRAWQNSRGSAHPVNTFAFEAFNEPWKGSDDGWGFWNIIRVPNEVLCGTFAGRDCYDIVNNAIGYYPLLANTNPNVTVDANQSWIGYTNIFPLNQSFIYFGTPLAIADLPAGFSTDTSNIFLALFHQAKGQVILSPNTFWYIPSDSFFVNSNGTPNVVVASSFYVQNDYLVNQNITFSGKVRSNTLGIDPSTGIQYTAVAYIQGFSADYSANYLASTPLVSGAPFSLSFNGAGWAHIQYGFILTGPNANPASVGNLGRVEIISNP